MDNHYPTQQQYIIPMSYPNGGAAVATEYVNMHQVPPPPPPAAAQYQQQVYPRQDFILEQQYQQQQQQLALLLQLQLQLQQQQLQLLVQHLVQQQQQQNLTALKKDKRRQTILNKLNKLEEKFVDEKDMYYRSNLHDLQLSLSTLHNNTNSDGFTKIQDYQELRDLELTRLRLGEEYLVYRTTSLFKQEYDHTLENYESLIKQVKQRLYEKINKKIVNLKQEKLLMDVSTSISQINYSSSAGNNVNGNLSANSNGSSRSRRREDSQRKRAAIETDYDSGYDSAGYTSQQPQQESSSSSRKRLNKNHNKILTDDDFDQHTMDELDELLNGGAGEGSDNGYHSTRAQTHITSGNKKHKTVQDSLKPLEEDEVLQDLKMLRNV